jgi:hypothetical protein
MLLADLRDIPVGARKSEGQLVAEPERGVVPAIERDRRDRQARPLGELRGDQPGGEARDTRSSAVTSTIVSSGSPGVPGSAAGVAGASR